MTRSLLLLFPFLILSACSDSIPAGDMNLEPLAQSLREATHVRFQDKPVKADAIWIGFDPSSTEFPAGQAREHQTDQLALPMAKDEWMTSLSGVEGSPEATGSDSELPSTREDLSSMRTVVKIFNGQTDAGITIPGFGGLTLGSNESSLSIYYIESRVIDTPEGEKVYGVGYSTHYLFKRLKRGIDVSDLASVAASVQLQNTRSSVYYTLQTFGISSLDLVGYFKPTVNAVFDVEGFGVIQSSIDGIHSILSDEELSERARFEPVELEFVNPADLKI